MANTPAAGPKPTTRTKTRAQISSGMLRKKMSSQRTSCRTQEGRKCIRPDSADIDRIRVETIVKGIAKIIASVKPAVAMATVRHVSFTTSTRNSEPSAGGKKSAKKRMLTLRLSGSKKIQGLNSVATSAGMSKAKAAIAQKTRLSHAGSRRCGERVVLDMKTA